MNIDRGAAARSIRRVLILLLFALLAGYVYSRFLVRDSPWSIIWMPALCALLNGLYLLVFAPEAVAMGKDAGRRHWWERALDLGVEPSEQGVRWSGIAQMAGGVLLLALWWVFERPS